MLKNFKDTCACKISARHDTELFDLHLVDYSTNTKKGEKNDNSLFAAESDTQDTSGLQEGEERAGKSCYC